MNPRESRSDGDGQLVDRVAIEELLIRYCTAIDNHDWALMDTVFEPSALWDSTSVGGVAGPYREIREWQERELKPFEMTIISRTSRSRSTTTLPDPQAMYRPRSFPSVRTVRARRSWSARHTTTNSFAPPPAGASPSESNAAAGYSAFHRRDRSGQVRAPTDVYSWSEFQRRLVRSVFGSDSRSFITRTAVDTAAIRAIGASKRHSQLAGCDSETGSRRSADV